MCIHEIISVIEFSFRTTQRLIEESELCVYGCARKGGKTQQVFLKQGHMGLFVHCRHALGERNEEENSAHFLQLPGEHLEKEITVINISCAYFSHINKHKGAKI